MKKIDPKDLNVGDQFLLGVDGDVPYCCTVVRCEGTGIVYQSHAKYSSGVIADHPFEGCAWREFYEYDGSPYVYELVEEPEECNYLGTTPDMPTKGWDTDPNVVFPRAAEDETLLIRVHKLNGKEG